MTHWMFSCKDVSQKVSYAMDAPLPPHHRMAIALHLLMCRYCARFRRQLMMLRKMGRQVGDEPSVEETTEKLSKAAKERIKNKLRAISSFPKTDT